MQGYRRALEVMVQANHADVVALEPLNLSGWARVLSSGWRWSDTSERREETEPATRPSVSGLNMDYGGPDASRL
jgi:hypothetical protein